jgi:hypothetical protein
VTTRETAHALLDRYPDDELDDDDAFLSCRRSANGTDLSVKAILARHGATPMSAEDFERHFGHLPTDSDQRLMRSLRLEAPRSLIPARAGLRTGSTRWYMPSGGGLDRGHPRDARSRLTPVSSTRSVPSSALGRIRG